MKDKDWIKWGKAFKIPYDKDNTELKCDKCNHIETEWYNTQPGDPCRIYTNKNCNGMMIRVIKHNII